jgi:hypothetical protein
MFLLPRLSLDAERLRRDPLRHLTHACLTPYENHHRLTPNSASSTSPQTA